MHPHQILGIDIFHWFLMVVVPLSVVYLGREVHRAGFSYRRFFILQIALLAVCLVGAKIFSLWLRDWQWHGWDYELPNGWRYPGAIIGLVVLGPLILWKLLPGYPVARIADKVVIVMAFSLAAYRVTCVMNGCCIGPVCDGNICITYAHGSAAWYHHMQQGLLNPPTGRSLPVLPLHLFFMAASLAVAFFLVWYERRKLYDGQLVLLYLLLHEGSKAILESWRMPYSLNLQLVSIVLALLAAAILIWNRQRLQKTDRRA